MPLFPGTPRHRDPVINLIMGLANDLYVEGRDEDGDMLLTAGQVYARNRGYSGTTIGKADASYPMVDGGYG